MQLAIDEIDKNNVIENQSFITGLNGTVVFPKTISDKHHILISNSVVDNGTYIGTLAHELTHIYDFIDYGTYYSINEYHKIAQSEMYWPFYYWTEYNAKFRGYLILNAITYGILNPDVSIEDQINYILQPEFEYHNNNIKAKIDYFREYGNEMEFIYSVIHFISRIAVWCNLFPDSIKFENMIEQSNLNPYKAEILLLETVFENMTTFEEANLKLHDLSVAIRLVVNSCSA